jgi:hypothetical protein
MSAQFLGWRRKLLTFTLFQHILKVGQAMPGRLMGALKISMALTLKASLSFEK